NTYQLSYMIGNTTFTGFGPTSRVDVLINNAFAFGDTNSTASPTIQNWQTFPHTFFASGALTSLTFLNADGPPDNNNGLDNVVLLDLGASGTPTPVPEPASMMLFMVGMVGPGLTRKMRKPRP